MADEHLYHQKRRQTQEVWERAFLIALENRKFEIDNYWKRTTYFWTIIAAVFVAYAASLETSSQTSLGSVIIAALGGILSLAWVLVNKGSKYWQQNWEAHVDLLENEFSGPIYKTVLSQANRDGSFKKLVTGACPYSVSTINLIVSIFVFLVWMFLFTNSLFDEFFTENDFLMKLIIAAMLFLFISALLVCGRSEISAEKPKSLTSKYSYIFRDL